MPEKIGLEAVLADAQFKTAFSNYMGSMNQMGTKTTSTSSSLSNSFASMGQAGLKMASIFAGVVVVGVTAALTAITGAMAASINTTMQWAETLDNTGDVLGTNAQQSAALAVAIKGVGGDVGTMTSQLTILTRGLEDSKGKIGPTGKVLKSLGISFKDANGQILPATDILQSVADKLAVMPDGLEKTALMTDLFGKSGKDLSDVMGALADGGLAKADAKAKAMGLSMSEEAVQGALKLGRSGNDLKMMFQGLLVKIGSGMIPVLQKLADWLMNALGSPAIQNAITSITQGIANLADAFMVGFGDGDIVGGISNALYSLGEFSPIFDTLGDAVVIFGTLVTDLMTDGVGVAFDNLRELLSQMGVPQSVLDGMTTIYDWVTGSLIPMLEKLWNWLQVNIPIAIGVLSSFWTTTLLPAITTVWSWITRALLPLLSKLWTWIMTNLPVALATLSKFWTETLLPAITNVWAWIQGTLLPLLSDLWDWVMTNLPGALETLSNFWTETLLPAITTVWNWITGTLLPMFQTVWNWLQINVPAAIQTLTDYWTNTLLPAITTIWNFLNEHIFPIFESIKELFNVGLSLAITALAGLWEKVLLPKLTDVWLFIQDNILPIFKAVGTWIDEKAKVAFGDFKTWLENLSGALETLGGWFDKFKGWIDDMITKLKAVKLPWWMTPGSPTPFELGIRGISLAMRQLATIELPNLQESLGSINMSPNRITSGSLRGNNSTVINRNVSVSMSPTYQNVASPSTIYHDVMAALTVARI